MDIGKNFDEEVADYKEEEFYKSGSRLERLMHACSAALEAMTGTQPLIISFYARRDLTAKQKESIVSGYKIRNAIGELEKVMQAIDLDAPDGLYKANNYLDLLDTYKERYDACKKAYIENIA